MREGYEPQCGLHYSVNPLFCQPTEFTLWQFVRQILEIATINTIIMAYISGVFRDAFIDMRRGRDIPGTE